MEWWQALLLGVLQGITEFLPISSSGHLVLVQQFFPVTGEESTAALFFDGMLHLGTTVAVLWYFLKTSRGPQTSASVQLSLAHWLGLLFWASLPAALAVGLFERHIRESFLNVPMVATNFCILGTVLWLTDRLPAGKLTAGQMRWFHALLIGMGQALSALFRGLSRSGMTLSVALLLQLERTWAVRFSFAMSLVANLGLAGLGLVHAWRDAQTAHWLTLPFLSWTLLATLTSAVVGYATLQPLLRLVQRSRMRWFGYYLWLAGLVAWGIYAWRSA